MLRQTFQVHVDVAPTAAPVTERACQTSSRCGVKAVLLSHFEDAVVHASAGPSTADGAVLPDFDIDNGSTNLLAVHALDSILRIPLVLVLNDGRAVILTENLQDPAVLPENLLQRRLFPPRCWRRPMGYGDHDLDA